ncbi:MAG: hypothetical protein R6V56_00425 [Lentisphaeria bacterium]
MFTDKVRDKVGELRISQFANTKRERRYDEIAQAGGTFGLGRCFGNGCAPESGILGGALSLADWRSAKHNPAVPYRRFDFPALFPRCANLEIVHRYRRPLLSTGSNICFRPFLM